MWSWLRRLVWLALIAGAGYAAFTMWQRKSAPAPAEPPSWPPLTDDAPTAPTINDDPAPAPWVQPDNPPNWVLPVGGECPDGYPIKVNEKSGIYHVPGGRFYGRTVPERCYSNEASAEADGYRRAKA